MSDKAALPKKPRGKNKSATERYNEWISEIQAIAYKRYLELVEDEKLEAAIAIRDFGKRLKTEDHKITLGEIQKAFEGGNE